MMMVMAMMEQRNHVRNNFTGNSSYSSNKSLGPDESGLSLVSALFHLNLSDTLSGEQDRLTLYDAGTLVS